MYQKNAIMSYQPLIEFFEGKIREYQSKGLKIFSSSSFQTHSLPMIHILSKIAPEIPVYFLDTGFHFPETLEFKDDIAEKFGIKVVEVSSPISKIMQRDANNIMLFASDPNRCCYFNKTLPMEPVLAQFDVWVSGVRKDQNENRSSFDYEAKGKNGSLRFHPMLDWTNQLIWQYIKEYNLPRHPLEEKGYMSIGCEPCTKSIEMMLAEDERGGRWFGLNKTECGLHTDLIEK
jgi:phosphoadenosine phosphosulfate reductase